MDYASLPYNKDLASLETILREADRAGGYCVHGKTPSLMSRLEVQGVGTVALPVQEAQIRSLIEVAERAPYGKGQSTVLDTTVRDCWQIDRTDVEVGGIGWAEAFSALMGRVTDGMGPIATKLEASPYKLLV